MGVGRILEDVGEVEVVAVTGGSAVGSEWALVDAIPALKAQSHRRPK